VSGVVFSFFNRVIDETEQKLKTTPDTDTSH